MRSVLLVISGFLLTVFQLSAEIIPVENWTLNMNPIPAVSGRRAEEPLRDFIDVKNNTIFLKHPLYGIQSYSGSTKARPGLLRITFTAQALSGAASRGVVKVVMYGYHFRDDNCTGKSEDLFWEKDFSVSGKKSLSVDFNITPEQLKCIFCDEQVPTFRFFTTFYLKEKSSGIALSNISISAATPLLVYGRKQISTTTWLLDELKADKAKDAERAALKKELATPVAPPRAVPKPKQTPVKNVEPVEVATPIEKFVSHIEAEMPALFDAGIVNNQLRFDKKPSNGNQKITLYLNPPAIPENFEYVVALDRVVWGWSAGIFDKNDRPLDKDGGYLPDGTSIMRLPYNCRRIDFESSGRNSVQGYIQKIFYRESKKK
jgi:hypothetical protein